MSEIVVVSRIITVWWTGFFLVMMTGVVSGAGMVAGTVADFWRSVAVDVWASVFRGCDDRVAACCVAGTECSSVVGCRGK